MGFSATLTLSTSLVASAGISTSKYRAEQLPDSAAGTSSLADSGEHLQLREELSLALYGVGHFVITDSRSLNLCNGFETDNQTFQTTGLLAVCFRCEKESKLGGILDSATDWQKPGLDTLGIPLGQEAVPPDVAKAARRDSFKGGGSGADYI